MTKRLLVLAYGIACYLVFLAVFLYSIAFIGDFWVGKTLDSPPGASVAVAIATNLLLFALFALQHSVMARPTFKRWWTRFVPPSIERSTYVLCSSAAWGLLMYLWQPIPGSLWTIEILAVRIALYVLFAAGWFTVFISTHLINHYEMFGLAQVWHHFRGTERKSTVFQTPALYKVVRHPLYVGWITLAWATPAMSPGHLLFALVATGYILIAIQLEERNLSAIHAEYQDYRRKVPMLVPGWSWFRVRMRSSRPIAADESALTRV